MSMSEGVVCVTGGSGLIGKRIVEAVLKKKYDVRVLSRTGNSLPDDVTVFTGDLLNNNVLRKFMQGAKYLFHCAAELNDVSKMKSTNVEGTRILFEVAKSSGIQNICHISSAGVIGETADEIVTEETECNPQNEYERTKYLGEKIAQEKIDGCSTVVLRPLNVVDSTNPGIIEYPIRGSVKDRIRFYIKGSECAHLVHAKKVANCALYFMNKKNSSPECYIVGEDELELNTFKDVWNTYYEIVDKKSMSINVNCPALLPYYVRKIRGRGSNLGTIRYSSQKLHDTGFSDPWTMKDIVKNSLNY